MIIDTFNHRYKLLRYYKYDPDFWNDLMNTGKQSGIMLNATHVLDTIYNSEEAAEKAMTLQQYRIVDRLSNHYS